MTRTTALNESQSLILLHTRLQQIQEQLTAYQSFLDVMTPQDGNSVILGNLNKALELQKELVECLDHLSEVLQNPSP